MVYCALVIQDSKELQEFYIATKKRMETNIVFKGFVHLIDYSDGKKLMIAKAMLFDLWQWNWFNGLFAVGMRKGLKKAGVVSATEKLNQYETNNFLLSKL